METARKIHVVQVFHTRTEPYIFAGFNHAQNVQNSHGDRAEEGRRSDRKHSANALWERDKSCMSMGASIASQSRSEGFNQSWKSIVIKEKLSRERTASVGVTLLNRELVRYPNVIFATCKRGGFVLHRATKLAKELMVRDQVQKWQEMRNARLSMLVG